MNKQSRINNREFSSGGVIIKKDAATIKVLLIKDGYGHWTWPKGNIEKDETPEQAAIREIAEEVGLKKIELIEKIDQGQYYYRRDKKLIFKTVYIHLFRALGEESLKVLKSEIDSAKWLSPQDALSMIEYKGAKEILKKAIDRYNKQ